jgi:NhaA family Na+:H+ antiporter
MGIAAGLFLGKQAGIMLFCGIAIALGFARLPNGASLSGFYATSVLCGIGFTMSLFIASLAFEQGGSSAVIMGDRLGILFGSCLSAVVGFLIMRLFNPASANNRRNHESNSGI